MRFIGFYARSSPIIISLVVHVFPRNVSAQNGLYARGDASLPKDFI